MAEQSLTASPSGKVAARPDADAAKGVILEILRQSLGQNGARPPRSQINHTFWLAHLYYARENRGFLTTWPILRAAGGVEISKVDMLLGDLVDEGLVEAEVINVGPIPVSVYACTPAAAGRHLPDAAAAAVTRAVAGEKDGELKGACCSPITVSRAW
jgi:hypothetical protein